MKISLCMLISAFTLFSTSARAELINGIDFPQGTVSFADEWVQYSPSANVIDPYNNPQNALGIPDGSYVSLGDEGSLVLRFTDNALTTSGDSTDDLWIFEIGSLSEPTSVSISTNGTTWINVGDTSGGKSGIDIDAYVGSGVVLGGFYSYLRLTDMLPHQSSSPYEGADIDAVGAISSTSPVPIPGALWLLGTGLLGIIGFRKRAAGGPKRS